ncbi:MAG: alpha-galactosidase [Faecalimonas sp.]|nr:alpha-galactosidase [Faecalimonas sp.]
MITVKQNYFYLHTANTTYVIRRLSDGTLNHCYYGAGLPEEDMDDLHLFIKHDCTVHMTERGHITTPDALPMECPGFGRGDFRRPAAVIKGTQGRAVNEFVYKSHCILKGKPSFVGLPQFSVETEELETLEIKLEDKITGVELVYYYTPFEKADAIVRRMEVHNATGETVQLEAVASATLDFETEDFEMVSLSGAWSRERHVERYPLHRGESVLASRYGLSGHHSNPFAALVAKDACEEWGKVYGFALVYSGNFMISAEAGQYGGTRLWMGIHPDMFSWELKAGESFATPEAVLTYSQDGFGGMSKNFHTLCREHLGACADKTKEHPVVLNLWEATEFEISEEKLLEAIEATKNMGIDTLVIDDGWFGHRDGIESSLGDWYIHKEKFPNGLQPIVDACKKNGMKLGIWFEPENVSPDSDFYRAHPDWAIKVEGVEPKPLRCTYTLDLGRAEVVDAVYEAVATILRTYEISYVKWDMNRNMTDNGASWLPPHRQKEFEHRQMLGAYELMRRLTSDFPYIFFEGCASGGGRFDFGLLYYMPQIWTSDCTDAWERMMIQYGTSFVYPAETISAHVSECPHFGTDRILPFQSRCDVANIFSYGYELDPIKLSAEEREAVARESARHRRMEAACGQGTFYRLRSPFAGNTCAWQVVSEDSKHSVVFYGTKLRQPNFCGEYLLLAGLDDDTRYRVEPLGITMSGKTLKNAGIPIREQGGDFHTKIFELTAENA